MFICNAHYLLKFHDNTYIFALQKTPRKSKRIKWINARLSDIVDIVKETLKSIYYGRKFLICIL